MAVRENPQFTKDYYAADRRYIGNAVQVHFRDGSSTPRVAIDYPIGHRLRRSEGVPVMARKFRDSVAAVFPGDQARRVQNLFDDPALLDAMSVANLVSQMTIN